MSKLITIIGAGPGISYAVAQKFGKQDFKIALIARNEGRLKTLAQKLKQEGVEASCAAADVASEESLTKALSRIRETGGHAEMILDIS